MPKFGCGTRYKRAAMKEAPLTASTSPHTHHYDRPCVEHAAASQLVAALFIRFGNSEIIHLHGLATHMFYTLVSFYLARRSGAVGMTLSPWIDAFGRGYLASKGR